MNRCTGTSCARWAVVLMGLTGCVAARHTTSIGACLDAEQLAAIKVGQTQLQEVLERLGPPEYIIDGQQTLAACHPAAYLGEAIPTRTLAAPEDAVILLYVSTKADVGGVHGALVGHGYEKTQASEVMVYISKRDYCVQRVVAGG